jgi:hypothetical protein
MGILSDGTPFLSGRALATLCESRNVTYEVRAVGASWQ